MQKSRSIPLCLHLMATIIYGTTIYCLTCNGLPPGFTHFGHFIFLTFWNLIIQLITFALSLFIDLKEQDSDQLSSIIKLRDHLFNSLAFPLSAHVTITFWIIYAIDRELVYPTSLEHYWPQSISHTIILPIVLLDNHLVDHRRREQKRGLLLTCSVTVCYILWMFNVKLVTHYWPYPILTVLNWPSKVVFLGFLGFATILYYEIGGHLYDMSWRLKARDYSLSDFGKVSID